MARLLQKIEWIKEKEGKGQNEILWKYILMKIIQGKFDQQCSNKVWSFLCLWSSQPALRQQN